MELWIRNQDRTSLVKIDELNIGKVGSFWVIKDKNPRNILGSYKDFDKALEVLDDIQTFIEKQGTSEATSDEQGIINGIQVYGNVYEMPKE